MTAAVGGPVVALVSVVASIAVLVAIRGHSVASSSAGATVTGSPSPSAQPSPRPALPSAKPKLPAIHRAPPKPPATKHAPSAVRPTSTAPVALPPLVVLNDSRRVGLASAAAALFRAGGWPVAWVGDWRGLIPLTTVYYSPDAAAAAQRLAARFPAVLRVRPRFPGLPVAPLVVIVTREFPA